MPKKGKKLDEKVINQHMEAYSETPAAAFLDDVFGKWDRLKDTKHAAHLPQLDRADHIIINGRTATEMLMEQFQKGKDFPMKDTLDYPMLYGNFYKENAKTLINQMVSDAMMNGDKVEVFVPDRTTGKIPKEPMQLTPQGYQPSGPLAKPAQMTRWQKFWSKLGFYKKEKAAVMNYEQEIAARKKVQFCNKAARASLTNNAAKGRTYNDEIKEYARDVFEDMKKNYPETKGDPSELPEGNGYKTHRSSFHSLALCVLATKRNDKNELMYSNEKMFDFADENMMRARADAAREVYEHYKKGDKDWLADLQVEAGKVLPERVNVQAAKLDFSKSDLTEQQGYQEFALLCDTAFDQSQDIQYSRETIVKRHGEKEYDDLVVTLSDFPQNSFREFGQALSAQKNLLNGVEGPDKAVVGQAIGKTIFGRAAQQQIAMMQKENPNMKYTEMSNADKIWSFTLLSGQLLYNENALDDPEGPAITGQLVKLTQERSQNPEKFNEQIINGVFENRIKLKECSMEAGNNEPFKFDLQSAKTVELEMKSQQRDTAGVEL